MITNGKLVPWKSFVRDDATRPCNVSRDFSTRHVRKVKTRMKLSTERVHKTFIKRVVSELSTEHAHKMSHKGIIDRIRSQNES